MVTERSSSSLAVLLALATSSGVSSPSPSLIVRLLRAGTRDKSTEQGQKRLLVPASAAVRATVSAASDCDEEGRRAPVCVLAALEVIEQGMWDGEIWEPEQWVVIKDSEARQRRVRTFQMAGRCLALVLVQRS
jgi:hypothetical protein